MGRRAFLGPQGRLSIESATDDEQGHALTRVKIQNHKSITDSGWVAIDQVTCLVGKNESGKTAFLQALEKLNPVEGSQADFNSLGGPQFRGADAAVSQR